MVSSLAQKVTDNHINRQLLFTSKRPQNWGMSQKFTIKEIAFHAGLSPATVDRALHGRQNVRQVTRDRVNAAIAELDRQYGATQLEGKKITIDVLMQAPARFSDAVRTALETELPVIKPAAFRARFHMAEVMSDAEIVAKLYGIARRGSQGIILKVPATPRIEACLDDLRTRNIPVITYVTDVAAHLRLAYVGMENHRAGATAAYLMHQMRGRADGKVLLTLSSQMFLGEDQRRIGFLDQMAKIAPTTGIVTVSEGLGVNRTTKKIVLEALSSHDNITCVYSIGGGNRAVLAAFQEARRRIEVFAAHDLDRTNQLLLKEGQLSFVLHHDFRSDARQIALHFLKHHRLLPASVDIPPTDISIACPI